MNHETIWSKELKLRDVFIRNDGVTKAPFEVQVRLRHRAPLIPARYSDGVLHFETEIKRPASGQSAVFYDGEVCLGGGIIK